MKPKDTIIVPSSLLSPFIFHTLYVFLLKWIKSKWFLIWFLLYQKRFFSFCFRENVPFDFKSQYQSSLNIWSADDYCFCFLWKQKSIFHPVYFLAYSQRGFFKKFLFISYFRFFFNHFFSSYLNTLLSELFSIILV
jgi:hypothetical protein